MKSYIRDLSHKIFLPRGRQYVSMPALEENWEKRNIAENGKNIVYIHQKTSQPKPLGIVILSHPYLSDAKLFFLKNGHTDMYLENGFHVYILDYNGFGESKFTNFDYPTDLRILADFLKSTYPSLPICGHGISFGASQLINYSMSNGQVCDRIIIENCLDSNTSYYKKRNRKLYYMMTVLMRLFPNVNKDHAYTENIKRIQGNPKVLFIYNNADRLTTIEMGRAIEANCPVESQFEIFDGDHLEAISKDYDKYKKTIFSFLPMV